MYFLLSQLELIWVLAKRDLITRYNNTFLGFFWTLVHPLIFSLTYYYVFRYVFKVDIPNYLLFLLAGMFPWTWLTTNISQSTGSVLSNAGIVKKVKFNRLILPISTVTQNGINFIFSICIFLAFMLSQGQYPSISWLWYFPIMFIQQAVIILGISYLISAANVFYRDLDYMIGLMLNIIFYFTPVGYSMDKVPKVIQPIVALNPFTGLIQGWRELLLHNGNPLPYLLIPSIVSIIVLVLGVFVYSRLQKDFAELL